MTTKMVFHGSDIEKICDYYHLNKDPTILATPAIPEGSKVEEEASVGYSGFWLISK